MGVEGELQKGFVTTTVDSLINWDYVLEMYEKAMGGR